LKVAIFDYGAGNIFSLKNSLEKNGAQVDVITGLNKSKEYSGLLLPGVGNFDPAIRSIRDYSSTDFKDYVGEIMPVLGICLGMEMFFEKSEEGKEQGLNVINGEVVLLPNTMKVPHMGWNSLDIERQNKFLEGVDDGTRIRLSGKGEAGIKGGENGDLYIFVSVKSHSIFKRSEENLFFEFPISLADAALGATIEVPTIDGGKAKVKIPAGTQNGKQFRLRGKGMPMMRNKNYGDLYIQALTEVPVSLTKEQKNLLEQFKKLEDTKTNPIMKDFFEKAKRFWKN